MGRVIVLWDVKILVAQHVQLNLLLGCQNSCSLVLDLHFKDNQGLNPHSLTY
jgi:hypothetical protein